MQINQTSSTSEKEATSAPPTPIDAKIDVAIADKGLRAYLKIHPPSNGGAAPTLESLNATLSNHHISYHVDVETLNHLVENPTYGQDILIASGLAPVDGENGIITFLIKTEKATLAPKINEDGTIDYYNLDLVENVVAGQTLCTITFPTEGTPGISVQGRELPQRKGRPAPSYLGRNTVLSQDSTAILSKIDGQVEFVGNKINVDETFYIKENVDNSTGNVHVAGNLVIRGMVLPGFSIEAGGNIEIAGAVEHSKITAGGSIKLLSGMNSSELYCSGDLRCKFIENSEAFVKGNIYAESIISSHVKCGQTVKVSGAIAKLIGGSCIAGRNIEAGTIGSISNLKTTLELGTDESVMQRQQELVALLEPMEAQNEKLIPLLDILMQLEGCNRLDPEKKKILENVIFSYNHNLEALDSAKRELEEINLSIKAKGYGRIICSNTMHPGTRIIMGDTSRNIYEPLKNAFLYYHQGEINIGSAH